MLNIVLNNVEHVDEVRAVIRERFEPLLHEFPGIDDHNLTVIVDGASEADRRRGRPMSVRAIVVGGRYRAIARVQTVSDIYAASANAAGHLWRRLRRLAQNALPRRTGRNRSPVPNVA